ncbi:MAG: nucleotide exchange factor GrpE [Holosporaceae bacterium]
MSDKSSLEPDVQESVVAEIADAKETSAEVTSDDTANTQDDRLQELEAKNKELHADFLRALAEVENLKKRHVREKEETLKYATARLLKDMLSVSDNIARALSAPPQATADPLTKSLFEGVKLVQKDVERFLKNQGVVSVEAAGKTFDPHKHEAMREISDPAKKADEVVDVIQEGYMLHDRLLRPALVVVNKQEAAQPPDASPAE